MNVLNLKSDPIKMCYILTLVEYMVSTVYHVDSIQSGLVLVSTSLYLCSRLVSLVVAVD